MPADDKSVLLVEDEDNIALAIEFLVSRKGYDLKRVSSGEGAIASLQAEQPDLVILDVMLPKGSGYEVCQYIRETEALQSTKILMISAAGKMARRKGLALGADAFFIKPFDTKLLTQEMANLLGESDAA
ncbi:MAG: response regulator [Pseudomonadota bacterium]